MHTFKLNRDINLRFNLTDKGEVRYLVASKARIAKAWLEGELKDFTRAELADKLDIGISTLSSWVTYYKNGDFRYDNCLTVNRQADTVSTTFNELILAEEALKDHDRQRTILVKDVNVAKVRKLALDLNVSVEVA